jgi:hypothetical protein
MFGFRSLVLLMSAALGAAMLSGCAEEPKKTPPPMAPVIIPASSEQQQAAAEDFTHLDPSAKVGHVAGSRPSDMMAAVAGISGDDVKVGDTIVFADGRQKGIANGTIRSIDKTTDPTLPLLIVDYDFSTVPGGRAPVRGDLAIFFKPH